MQIPGPTIGGQKPQGRIQPEVWEKETSNIVSLKKKKKKER